MKASDATRFIAMLTSHSKVPVLPLLAQGLDSLVRTAENCKNDAQLDELGEEVKTWEGNLDRLAGLLEVLVATGIIDEEDQQRTMEIPKKAVAELLERIDKYKQSGKMRTYWHSPSSNKKLVLATTKLQRAWISLMTPLSGYTLQALLHIAEKQDEVAKKGDDILQLLERVSIEVGVKSGAMSKDALTSEVARMKKNLDKLNAVQIKPTDISEATKRLHKSASCTISVVEYRGEPAVSKTFTLQQSGGWSDKARKACFRELDALGQMSSRHVVRVHGLIKDYMPDKLVLIMEYLQEGDLRNRLNKEPPLEPKTRQRIMLHIARGMRHLHRSGVPHRHLTSSNVLLAGEGQDLIAKISDFGMANMENAITTSGLSRILATPSFRWRPPEQFNVELQQHTPGDFMKGDVYSFGVLCWETITDMEPWDGEGNTCKAVGNAVMKGKRLDIPPSISTGYSKLIEDCWKADPSSRPDFEDIEARLFSLCNESLTVDVKWGVKRGRLSTALAAFLLLLCMAVYAGRQWLSFSSSFQHTEL